MLREIDELEIKNTVAGMEERLRAMGQGLQILENMYQGIEQRINQLEQEIRQLRTLEEIK